MVDKAISEMNKKIISILNNKTDTIGIEVTTYCPLDCQYCSRRLLKRRDRELSWEEFMSLKPKLNQFERVIICGIGEPMVYRHIYDVVTELKQRIVIITSGSVPVDFERLNRKKNIELVVFSVDSPDEATMKAVAGNYNWDNLLRNIENARKHPSMLRMINCTVTEHNYKQIPELVEFVCQNRLQAISFTMALRNEAVDNIRDETRKYLESAKQLAVKGGIGFIDSFSSLNCMCNGNIVPYANLEGDVFPCCQGTNKEYCVGNILNQEFDDIWHGKEYKEFKKGGMCVNDCPIYTEKIIGLGGSV